MASNSKAFRKWLPLLIVPAIIGIFVSSCFYIAELNKYDNFLKEYDNHEHAWACNELVCDQEEHIHSSACYDCGLYYYHTHNTSCYCSKTEHTHDDNCYVKSCVYSAYSTNNSFAEARTSFLAPNCIVVISVFLIVVNSWLTTDANRSAEKIHGNISYESNNFFNEKSIAWLYKLKNWIKIIFYSELIGFVVFGIVDAINKLTELGKEFGYFVFFVWAFVGLILTFLTKTINMLVLQFLKNINIIREKIELLSVIETEDKKEVNKPDNEEKNDENDPENTVREK